MIKHVSKQPIFISIQNADTDYNALSGKYYFHSVKNNAAAFVREEGQLENYERQLPICHRQEARISHGNTLHQAGYHHRH